MEKSIQLDGYSLHRHAYLIIAHNRPDLLQNLVKMLDYKLNDIFIHIDAKARISDFRDSVHARYSRIFWLEDRVDVVWGDYSLVQCEMALFAKAIDTGEYSYIHLLSGVDIPLKSQVEIHRFFRQNNGRLFIGYSHTLRAEMHIARRTGLYHFPSKCGRNSFLNLVRRMFCALQLTLHVSRRHNLEMKMGPEWVSLTSECVKYLLSKTEVVKSEFSFTRCPDEIYKQTIIWNSSFRDQLFNASGDPLQACMRMIDWKRGKPYCFRYSDLDELMNSDRLFCRKVTDLKLAREIAKRLEVI